MSVHDMCAVECRGAVSSAQRASRRMRRVDVCEQMPEAIVRSAVDAVDEALGHLSGPAEAVLVFDCAARSARFGNPLAAREVDSIVSSLGDPPPAMAGSRGEIGRIRGARRPQL